jgi:hypothetical protein
MKEVGNVQGTTHAAHALGEAVSEAAAIDWSEPRLALPAASGLLDRIVPPGGPAWAAAAEILAGGAAAGACESFPGLDKIVLWQSPDSALRLRLHVFFPGYFDRPHNHRWSFVSRVVAGGYLHSLYGGEDEILARARDGAPPPRHVYPVTAGSEYFLDHTMVHSLRADTPTISLVLRGPAAKQAYFTMDAGQGKVRWSTGASAELPAELAAKSMTADGFARVSRSLTSLGLL